MAIDCFGWARPQVSAVMRPTKEYPFMFSFFSEDGKDFQLYVDSQVSASDYPHDYPMASESTPPLHPTSSRAP